MVEAAPEAKAGDSAAARVAHDVRGGTRDIDPFRVEVEIDYLRREQARIRKLS